MLQKSPKFAIVDLQPLTVYCVEARVHSFASWNKSSNFSDRQCEKTGRGEHLLGALNGARVDKALHWDLIKRWIGGEFRLCFQWQKMSFLSPRNQK